MPIHHRIGPEIIRRGLPLANQLFKAEARALNYSWKGYKHKSSIVSGTRHGLFLGAAAGGLLSGQKDPGSDGTFQPTPPGKFSKKGNRFKWKNNRGSKFRHRRCKCKRPRMGRWRRR